jgi:glycosyltransferase involved in cell wall biosynthesis
MKSSIILLTWNEIDGVKAVVPKIPKGAAGEMICIDRDSTDGTREWLKKHGVKVYSQKVPGRAEAFREGIRRAKGDILVFFSPDGNEDPKDIARLIAKIEEGYDMVIATRFGKGAKSDDMTFARGFANRACTFLVNLFWNAGITDAINGFRAVRRSVFEKQAIDAKRFEVELEMSIRAAKNKLKIGEIPTHEYNRVGDQSKFKFFKDGKIFFMTVVRELFS